MHRHGEEGREPGLKKNSIIPPRPSLFLAFPSQVDLLEVERIKLSLEREGNCIWKYTCACS